MTIDDVRKFEKNIQEETNQKVVGDVLDVNGDASKDEK